jgi:hypothetical protein
MAPRDIFTAGQYRVCVYYLDDEPADVGERIGESLRRASHGTAVQPLLGAPFESMVKWDWNRF